MSFSWALHHYKCVLVCFHGFRGIVPIVCLCSLLVGLNSTLSSNPPWLLATLASHSGCQHFHLTILHAWTLTTHNRRPIVYLHLCYIIKYVVSHRKHKLCVELMGSRRSIVPTQEKNLFYEGSRYSSIECLKQTGHVVLPDIPNKLTLILWPLNLLAKSMLLVGEFKLLYPTTLVRNIFILLGDRMALGILENSEDYPRKSSMGMDPL